MEQFSLEKYLENPSRKITTRYGDREVRIICTDRKGKCPIVALMVNMDDGSEYITSHSINGWIDDEEKYPDKRDLFFADEGKKLTEFEGGLFSLVSEFWQKYALLEEEVDIAELVKENSKELLNLARKEILKDLPKWKKAKKDEELDCHVAIQQDGRVVLSDFVQKDEYYITLDALKKLPKEE